ncbi:class I SAM-dependent methyltransferase [Flavitalea sp. BT771]|uniref:class I SAM-dependent methyltransferase n=1 Tax=Flavitalea sp. BT771 TaxID=3063329 RepID=UPI0026E20AC7|nr:class I SAM-dependent methyltransferase [Flavitalea sp. BT771]MDO6432640.1 class I SAM-dependent methyltransferase [Flavitalea sp. BT771]MDV6222084.1 class I SAM-dependent methyltransferase [Flavitalea sp. BT771]
MNKRMHWDKIFAHKNDNEKSWFQPYPATSVAFIEELNLPKNAAIIDVGGGDSRLADTLLEKGYTDITVLDISAAAIQNARERLGKDADRVQWIVGDILEFLPSRHYDCWHDRAVFHFVTQPDNIRRYTRLMEDSIQPHGALIIGTFAEDGPEKCSGLPVKRYSQRMLTSILQSSFEKIRCIDEKHETPFHTIQSFTFCSFRRA